MFIYKRATVLLSSIYDIKLVLPPEAPENRFVDIYKAVNC